ncbi:MAG: calcium/proton exchanger [Bryobacteraceae bacterium]
MSQFLKPSLNWLLVFVPVAVWLEHARPTEHLWIFATACLAVLPLAGWLGTATEHLAARTSEAVGGLLNATFGNAAELIIALIALHNGLFDVVKASLTGSIIGNTLLVMGAACLAGGLKYPHQKFSGAAARSQATMMTLAVIALVVPAAYHYLVTAAPGSVPQANTIARENDLSLEISLVLLVTYALSLVFSLMTHKELFSGAAEVEDEHGAPWSIGKSMGVLLAATAMIAWMSEILVGSVQEAAHTLGMTSVFVGVVVVAIIGNAAEHSTAIMVARKNRMDLSLGIAIGSSIQIAVFVAPVLVIASRFMAPRPMDLVFTPAELLATGLAVAITGQISSDGESNWFEGAQLLAVYLILSLLFYFLPEAVH